MRNQRRERDNGKGGGDRDVGRGIPTGHRHYRSVQVAVYLKPAADVSLTKISTPTLPCSVLTLTGK